MCRDEQQPNVRQMPLDDLHFELKMIRTYIRDINRDKKRRKRQIQIEIRRRLVISGAAGRHAGNEGKA